MVSEALLEDVAFDLGFKTTQDVLRRGKMAMLKIMAQVRLNGEATDEDFYGTRGRIFRGDCGYVEGGTDRTAESRERHRIAHLKRKHGDNCDLSRRIFDSPIRTRLREQGYTKAEIDRLPTVDGDLKINVDLMDVLGCRCKNGVVCIPHYLNGLRAMIDENLPL